MECHCDRNQWTTGTYNNMDCARAKLLQSCLTLCNPIDGSPPGSTAPGFSRQEYWSGLPSPSPMQESEKWKWSHSVVLDSQRPHELQPTRLLHPWDSPGKSTGVGCDRYHFSCVQFFVDCSPPGFSVLGILQARILKWVALPSSRGSSWSRDQTCVSYVFCISSWVLYH